MLVSVRSAAVAEIGARLATTALVHTAYRVHLTHNQGVVCDDDLFLPSIDRVGRLARPVLTVILAGRAHIKTRGFDRWLEAGDVMMLPTKAAVSMRQEGSPFRSIAIEWDPGSLGARPERAEAAPLDASFRRRVLDGASSLEAALRPDLAAIRLSHLVDILRAYGAPLVPSRPRDLLERPDGHVVRLSQALDAVLSSLDNGPSMVDLDARLGLSARQINRLVTDFNQRYGFNSLGWRDTRNRRRLLVGATLMTAQAARTELVARAMGYSSPSSFCHAMELAGLPSPGATARIVADLR